ncbi:hypothetical protein B0J18DRAFT_51890 [Chaetomium sp. MPI-SDFR-AT-0129]|nr:hypothetical protein B0J18DRAFT_51890 [Chaetomium sp. MPI-SDFR-AT-0129]
MPRLVICPLDRHEAQKRDPRRGSPRASKSRGGWMSSCQVMVRGSGPANPEIGNKLKKVLGMLGYPQPRVRRGRDMGSRRALTQLTHPIPWHTPLRSFMERTATVGEVEVEQWISQLGGLGGGKQPIKHGHLRNGWYIVIKDHWDGGLGGQRKLCRVGKSILGCSKTNAMAVTRPNGRMQVQGRTPPQFSLGSGFCGGRRSVNVDEWEARPQRRDAELIPSSDQQA